MVDSVATWNGRGKNTMDETHGGGKNSNISNCIFEDLKSRHCTKIAASIARALHSLTAKGSYYYFITIAEERGKSKFHKEQLIDVVTEINSDGAPRRGAAAIVASPRRF
jgi:hypothetical protein